MYSLLIIYIIENQNFMYISPFLNLSNKYIKIYKFYLFNILLHIL